MVKKIFLIALFLIFAQNFLFAAAPALENKSGESAIDFTLLDLNSKAVSLSDFKGKPRILFFWTTWCPYCRGELKQLNALQAELAKSNTEVLAINIEEPAEKVRRFMENNPFYYRVLLDTDAAVSADYAVMGVPTYVFIDKEEHIAATSHYFSPSKYKNIVSQ
ncbi:MAG: TlpA disulfide reductase family protein [Candidatus Omnitrophota bacterium]